jgi:hypothetical protein
MPEIVDINEEFQMIHVKSVGDVSDNDLKQTLSELIKLIKEKGYARIFVDHSKASSFPEAVPAFNFGAEVGRFLQGTSIALVTSKRTESDIAFFKDVASARGATVLIFYSEKPAIQWLSGQPGQIIN